MQMQMIANRSVLASASNNVACCCSLSIRIRPILQTSASAFGQSFAFSRIQLQQQTKRWKSSAQATAKSNANPNANLNANFNSKKRSNETLSNSSGNERQSDKSIIQSPISSSSSSESKTVFSTRQDELLRVLRRFPVSRFVVAYGSGASHQTGHADKPEAHIVKSSTAATTKSSIPTPASEMKSLTQPMIDLLFVTNSTFEWHRQNIAIHRSHYSFLAYFGASTVDNFGNRRPGIYYNTLIPVSAPIDEKSTKSRNSSSSSNDTFLIKYGIVRTDVLIRDLYEWDSLYLAGRLHKPVQTLTQPEAEPQADVEVTKAMRHNLRAAVTVACLLLEEAPPAEAAKAALASATSFRWSNSSERQVMNAIEDSTDFTYPIATVYRTITGISYMNDIRVGFAESPNKINNIVSGNLIGFNHLYEPIFEQLSAPQPSSIALQRRSQWIQYDALNRTITVDGSRDIRKEMWDSLPLTVLQRVYTLYETEILKREPNMNSLQHEDLRLFVTGDLQRQCNVMQQQQLLKMSIGSIVKHSSARQSLKGILTAGFRKSLKYAASKIAKRFKG